MHLLPSRIGTVVSQNTLSEAEYVGTLIHRQKCILASFIFHQMFRQIKVKDFDSSRFETDQIFYTSKDGTKIPMFLVHKKV